MFSLLLKEAIQDFDRKNIVSRLIICDKESDVGLKVIDHLNFPYQFSEYFLSHNELTNPRIVIQDVEIKLHRTDNKDRILAILEKTSGKSKDFIAGYYHQLMKNPRRTQYDIYKARELTGTIGIYNESERNYIYGFNIDPDFQGQGIGKEALALIIQKYSSIETGKELVIEVQTDNKNALGLYEKMGFQTTTEFKYFELGQYILS